MIRPSRAAFAVLAAALLAGGLLSGCATPIDSAGSGGTSAPAPTDDPGQVADADVEAAWLDGGRMIGIVTQGSSTCVPTAGDVSFASGVVDVQLVEPAADTPCTRDLVPRVTLVSTPEGVDPTKDVEIRVTGETYRGDTDLDGVAGLALGGETDFLPSAGWTGDDGQFVILTWGSSTCLPVVESVAATGPSDVTVTFVEPEADQVCTMDMAPQGTIVAIDDLENDDEAFAILQGGGFDGVRIPIIGSD